MPSSPPHCAGWVSFFYLHFIWVSLFKDRVVAMGKPHCNSSIWTFWSIGKLTDRTEIPVPELNSQFGKLTDRTEIPVPELNSQFDKLTDRSKGAPVPEPVEGALPKPYIYTVAYASGSECSVLFPCFSVLIRGKSSASVWSSFCGKCFCLILFP